MRTPQTDIVIRFRKANVLHMGDCFVGGFPFIDGNTGGTFDGLIRAHETVLGTVDDNTRIIRGHGPLGNKAELQAYHDMLVVVRDRVAKLVKAGKTQEQVVEARPTREFEEKYGGTNFNAAQWIRPRLRRPEDGAGKTPPEIAWAPFLQTLLAPGIGAASGSWACPVQHNAVRLRAFRTAPPRSRHPAIDSGAPRW